MSRGVAGLADVGGLFLHTERLGGLRQAKIGLRGGQDAANLGAAADEDDVEVGIAPCREQCAADDRSGGVIAAHRVERDGGSSARSGHDQPSASQLNPASSGTAATSGSSLSITWSENSRPPTLQYQEYEAICTRPSPMAVSLRAIRRGLAIDRRRVAEVRAGLRAERVGEGALDRHIGVEEGLTDDLPDQHRIQRLLTLEHHDAGVKVGRVGRRDAELLRDVGRAVDEREIETLILAGRRLRFERGDERVEGLLERGQRRLVVIFDGAAADDVEQPVDRREGGLPANKEAAGGAGGPPPRRSASLRRATSGRMTDWRSGASTKSGTLSASRQAASS